MINNTISPENLLPPQVAHVQNLVDSIFLNGFAVDLSETGTGKTYSACAVAREVNVPFLVICPKVVIPAWKAVCKTFGIKPLGITNYESLIRGNFKSVYTSWKKELNGKFGPAPEKKPLTEDKLRFKSNVPSNALIIFDEVHKCKAFSSTTSELLISAKEQGYKILSVSASAATNPIEMKAFGFANGLHTITDHNKFKTGFALMMGARRRGKDEGGSNFIFDPTTNEAKEGMRFIHDRLFVEQKCASRLTKDMMKTFFPENHVSATAFDMGANSSKINKVYDEMEAEIAKLEEKGYSDHIFAVIMKARRTAELLKIPSMIEMIEDAIRENKSVCVFLNFNESIDSCLTKLQKIYRKDPSVKTVTIRGGQTDKARAKAIEDFQNDNARIIICNSRAGGVGVSLHDTNGNFPRISFINPSWSAIELLQCLGRIHRANGKTECYQQIIFADGTIENRICEKVQARLQNLAMLNDRDIECAVSFYDLESNIEKANLN